MFSYTRICTTTDGGGCIQIEASNSNQKSKFSQARIYTLSDIYSSYVSAERLCQIRASSWQTWARMDVFHQVMVVRA